MFLKRSVPLPDIAPVTRKAGLMDDIRTMEPGESGVTAHSASTVRQTCKRVVLAWCELDASMRVIGRDAGLEPCYIAWPSQSDGSALETGKDFALVARLTPEQATKYRALGATLIEPRTVRVTDAEQPAAAA